MEPRSLPSGLAADLPLTPPPASAPTPVMQRVTAPLPQVRSSNPGSAVRGVVYTTRGGLPQALDVFLPAGTAPAGGWPTVLAVHGGGWRRFNRAEYEAQVAAPLLQAGFAVVAPDYALSAPGRSSWPLALDDLRDAVRWTRSSGVSLGLNPRRLAAMGESAGGHLVALLGTETDPTTRVNAVVDFFGPSDLAAMVNNGAQGAPAVLQFLGATPAQNPAAYAAASPVTRVRRTSAPIFIAQGTADPIVPASQSQALAAAYAAAGVPYQLSLLPGLGHGFGLRAGSYDLRPAIVAFLRATLVG